MFNRIVMNIIEPGVEIPFSSDTAIPILVPNLSTGFSIILVNQAAAASVKNLYEPGKLITGSQIK